MNGRSRHAIVIVRRSHSGKYDTTPLPFTTNNHRKVIIIGGGHNGLVTAAYLAKAGLDVLVLERRHIVGGAAVTEEIEPGKCDRCGCMNRY